MKKSFFSFAILAASLLMVSCGNTSNGSNGPAFATDTLTYSEYKWFDMTVVVPQGKGYEFTTTKPEALAEVAGSNMFYVVGDKVVIAVNDFDSKTIDEWKEIIQTNGLEKEKQGIADAKIAGRTAFRYPSLMGDSELKKYGYIYYVDFKDFSEAGLGGYNNFMMTVYPADGQPETIDGLLEDEEVKFLLDNMIVTPKE